MLKIFKDVSYVIGGMLGLFVILGVLLSFILVCFGVVKWAVMILF